MSSQRIPHLTSRLQGFGTTIFADITRLALEHQAINLGQGFPDFDGASGIKEAAKAALDAGHNQYARSHGVPALNAAIAAHQRQAYGLDYDPDSEVTVYSGATEALAVALQALCEVGDEVVLFEPVYDSYRAGIAMAGATPRVVPLLPPSDPGSGDKAAPLTTARFTYDPEALERAITAKTRLLLLNTPHNPTGKVFTRVELEHIARLCTQHDLIAVTDEVYEHLVYEGSHLCLASLPGMKERTVVISSAGKTFSFTGWKVGWSTAPAELTRALRVAHQFITFATATPLQHAVASALGAGEESYRELATRYRALRDRLGAGLRELGFSVHVPEGGYFICADIRPLGLRSGRALCQRLPEVAGVAAIPASAFYLTDGAGDELVRFAFCKREATLDEGLARLQKHLSAIRALGV
ncbi:MAG: aminotransferase class I/II-fold pyridoxal phosphate-dependent enzyme [Polyangiaceae bacterium]|nr:aminotransferase class I/II-fold pyridoxal phosphate-dependent enzyme [Polyangiaceae bacterium]MCW5789595.1 aminotransferase class I/II-fold pyridoxal phosphate-dependent enzyme [Polyangiaceae bacterium]